MKKYTAKEIFNIPNCLTYFRLICVPIFALVFFAKFKGAVYVSLAIFAVAEITDKIDGIIARKYNMITDIGKVLDPLADKLLQVTALVCLCIVGFLHWIFAALLLFKEALMILGGLFIIPKGVIIQANSWGKRATEILGYSSILLFFHDLLMQAFNFPVDWVLIGIGLVVTYMALINYGYIAYKQLKNKSKASTEENAVGVSASVSETDDNNSSEE